jgi:hypothetical protein
MAAKHRHACQCQACYVQRRYRLIAQLQAEQQGELDSIRQRVSKRMQLEFLRSKPVYATIRQYVDR